MHFGAVHVINLFVESAVGRVIQLGLKTTFMETIIIQAVFLNSIRDVQLITRNGVASDRDVYEDQSSR
jgi:hypothetical protein